MGRHQIALGTLSQAVFYSNHLNTRLVWYSNGRYSDAIQRFGQILWGHLKSKHSPTQGHFYQFNTKLVQYWDPHCYVNNPLKPFYITSIQYPQDLLLKFIQCLNANEATSGSRFQVIEGALYSCLSKHCLILPTTCQKTEFIKRKVFFLKLKTMFKMFYSFQSSVDFQATQASYVQWGSEYRPFKYWKHLK